MLGSPGNPDDSSTLLGGAAYRTIPFAVTTASPLQRQWDDAGPMLRIGALGAGIGIGIDAMIRRRRTIRERSPGSARLHTAPVAAPGTALRLLVGFE